MVSGISFCAGRTGLEVMLRLVDEEDDVKAVFVSLEGIKMSTNLDAGILDRALEAAFDAVAPFLQVTLPDEKK